MDPKDLTELFRASGEDYRNAFNEGVSATISWLRDRVYNHNGLTMQKVLDTCESELRK